MTARLNSAALGRLPGDIRIESERCKVFIPITSMVVLSIILTLLLNLFLQKR